MAENLKLMNLYVFGLAYQQIKKCRKKYSVSLFEAFVSSKESNNQI